MFDNWKTRALAAETALEIAQVGNRVAREELDGIQLRLANRAALISIARDGRALKFTFVRNGDVIVIETISTWSDDIDQWKKELFE
jgi:hypothetical protein